MMAAQCISDKSSKKELTVERRRQLQITAAIIFVTALVLSLMFLVALDAQAQGEILVQRARLNANLEMTFREERSTGIISSYQTYNWETDGLLLIEDTRLTLVMDGGLELSNLEIVIEGDELITLNINGFEYPVDDTTITLSRGAASLEVDFWGEISGRVEFGVGALYTGMAAWMQEGDEIAWANITTDQDDHYRKLVVIRRNEATWLIWWNSNRYAAGLPAELQISADAVEGLFTGSRHFGWLGGDQEAEVLEFGDEMVVYQVTQEERGFGRQMRQSQPVIFTISITPLEIE